MNRKNKILLLTGILSSIGIYVIINKAIKKNLKKKIYAALDGSTGKTEEKRINDIISGKKSATLSDAFNPKFFQTIAHKTGRGNPMDPKDAIKKANDIYNSWNFFDDDEEKVYGVLRSLASKLQVSFVTFWYNKKHGSDLYEDLNYKLSDEEKAIAFGIVRNLPSF